MKLTLTQRDIEAAIKAYVNSLLTMNSGTDMEIAFTATRGTDGLIAEIDINYMGLTSLNTETPAPQPASNRSAPAAPRASRKASESSTSEADEASTETQEAEMEDKEPDPETPAPAPSKSSGRSLFSDFLPG